MPPTLDQLTQDKDFLNAQPTDQTKYLSSIDPDFAKATPQDQSAYLAHITQRVAPKISEPPVATLSQGPSTFQNFKSAVTHPIDYLSDVEKDITEGGGNTIVGRTLGHMQARGDQGYSGLNAGQSSPVPGAVLGGPLIGPVKAVRGNLRVLNPTASLRERVGGLNEEVGGAMQALGPLALTSPSALPRIVAAAIAQRGTESGAKALGVPQEYSELAGNIAGGAAAGAPEIVRGALPTGPGTLRHRLAKSAVDPLVYEGVAEGGADARYGIDPSRGLVDEGLVGTKRQLVGDKTERTTGSVQQRLGELKSAADNILQNHPNSRRIFDAEPIIDEAINRAQGAARDVANEGQVNKLEALRAAMKTRYGNIQGTPAELNALKTSLQQAAKRLGGYKNVGPDDAAAANAMMDAAHGVRGIVDQAVPEAADLNARMSNLIDAQSGLQRKQILEKGGTSRPGLNHGFMSHVVNATVGSAPVRTGVARILAGAPKGIPEPMSYVPPPIRGLLPPAPTPLGSPMEPIEPPGPTAPTLPYRPSLQKPPAFVGPMQIKPAPVTQELLSPNRSPQSFPEGSFPQQGSLFQTPVEAPPTPADIAALENIRQANLANVPEPVKSAITRPSIERMPTSSEDALNRIRQASVENGPPPRATNGSGESAASQEAINRVSSENARGVKRYRIDTRSGKETPLIGVDAVDATAGPYDEIVERGPQGETTLDKGAKARPRALGNKAIQAENDWFQQAKTELGPNADVRKIAQRAQALKEASKKK